MSSPLAAVRWVASVESTQDAVHALAEQGAPAGLAVAALEQTSGRGSRRRDWSSGTGGLWMSVLLRPAQASGLQVLGLRVGLSLMRVLDECGARDLMLKWPNDILADGKKAGGILCEARWSGHQPSWIAVGVGLNVRNALPAELRESATTLGEHGVTADLETLAQCVADAVSGTGSAVGPLTGAECATLAERDWLRGQMLASPECGRAAGMEADGALRVVRGDGSMVLVRAAPVETAARVILLE